MSYLARHNQGGTATANRQTGDGRKYAIVVFPVVFSERPIRIVSATQNYSAGTTNASGYTSQEAMEVYTQASYDFNWLTVGT